VKSIEHWLGRDKERGWKFYPKTKKREEKQSMRKYVKNSISIISSTILRLFTDF
jgi:hypothetical protein